MKELSKQLKGFGIEIESSHKETIIRFSDNGYFHIQSQSVTIQGSLNCNNALVLTNEDFKNMFFDIDCYEENKIRLNLKKESVTLFSRVFKYNKRDFELNYPITIVFSRLINWIKDEIDNLNKKHFYLE